MQGLQQAFNGIEDAPQPIGFGGSSATAPAARVEGGSAGGQLLRRLLEAGTGFSIDEIASFTSLDELETRLNAVDGVTVDIELIEGFPRLELEIEKELGGEATLDVNALGGTISIGGNVDISAMVGFRIVVGIDSDGIYVDPIGFRNESGEAIPELTLSKFNIDGDISASGKFGFLDVTLSNPSLVMDENVVIAVDLVDPGNGPDGDDGLIWFDELLSFDPKMVDFRIEGNLDPADADDLVLGTDVSVSAILPSLDAPFNLADARIDLTWDDITKPLDVTPSASANGGDGGLLMKFLDFNVGDFAAQLTQMTDLFREATGTDVMAVEIPLLNKSIGDLLASESEPRTVSGDSVSSVSEPAEFARQSIRFLADAAADTISLVRGGDVVQFLDLAGELVEGIVDEVNEENGEVTFRYDSRFELQTELGLQDGLEILRDGEAVIEDLRANVESFDVVEAIRVFSAAVDFAEGTSLSELGVVAGDTVEYLTTLADGTKERVSGIVDSLTGDVANIRFPSTRKGSPSGTSEGAEDGEDGLAKDSGSITFFPDGSLDRVLTSTLGNLTDPDYIAANVPTLSELIFEFADLMGVDLDEVLCNDEAEQTVCVDVTFEEGILTIAPQFGPEALAYETSLDFGEAIPGASFSASGNFEVEVQPTFRLPVGIDMNIGGTTPVPFSERVFLVDDEDPEITLSVSAQVDNPRARAELGFLAGTLEEQLISENNGIVLDADFTINLQDPSTPADGKITFSELLDFNNLPAVLDPGVEGTLDIDGLQVVPEAAGVVLGELGKVTIAIEGGFTEDESPTFDTTKAGYFNGFRPPVEAGATDRSLQSLVTHIDVDTPTAFDDFGNLTPGQMVSMFMSLGNTLEDVAANLTVPADVPFVGDVIGEVVSFVDTLQDFGRKLYFNPRIMGDAPISAENGRLSEDATFVIGIENADPVLVTVTA